MGNILLMRIIPGSKFIDFISRIQGHARDASRASGGFVTRNSTGITRRDVSWGVASRSRLSGADCIMQPVVAVPN